MPHAIANNDDRNAFLAPLDEQKIRKYLAAYGLSDIQYVDVFSSLSSTNDYLLDNRLANTHISICLSEQQTKGRGRYGHQWVSPSGLNLYMSMSWPLRGWKQEFEMLGLWLLVAIAELLESHGCKYVQLKWPNDVCIENKKLAGVLIERKVNQANNSLVIGVGINVAMSLQNDVDIDRPWIDLLAVKSNWGFCRNQLAANIISTFYHTLTRLDQNRLGDLNAKWQPYDMLFHKTIEFSYQDKMSVGFVEGIDRLGQIVLNVDGKLVHMHSGLIRGIKLIGNTK